MLTQVDAGLTAGREPFKDLVIADGEAAPLAQKEVLGLEVRYDTAIDQQAREPGRVRRYGTGSAQPGQRSAEAILVHDAALVDEIQKLVGGSWGRHGDDSREESGCFPERQPVCGLPATERHSSAAGAAGGALKRA